MQTVTDRKISIRAAALALLTLPMLALPALAAAPHPLEVAAQFLMLTEEQAAQIVSIRQGIEETVAPLAREIAHRRALLDEMVNGDEPNPAEVGVLVLSIRALEQQVATLLHQAASQMHAILDAEQLDRLQTASTARPVCQVIPALTAVGLL